MAMQTRSAEGGMRNILQAGTDAGAPGKSLRALCPFVAIKTLRVLICRNQIGMALSDHADVGANL